MDLDELILFIIQERLNCFCQNRDDEKLKEGRTKSDEWERILKEKCPELAEINEEYLNWFMLHQGEEVEESYLFGVQDGVKLMMRIMKLNEE